MKLNSESINEYIVHLQNHALVLNGYKGKVKEIPLDVYASLLDSHIELANKYRDEADKNNTISNKVKELMIVC
ncbi:hypothetical protein BAOM_3077 [Peribacillus asahii]|uniref:Uncharacterized protein n=1 Tax=Peribacillus asahii TaxID=228899 RepID=A0A3Q9RPD4_9BACI|nr:hypothetical protein [Peribacillus asahii]AZV43686.1 hypothetical protein BAOM_3077 [Peribacillus asahii]